MSAREIPSLWKLWITLACVVASTGTRLDCVVVDCGLCRCLYRYSTGYRLAANTSRIMWWSDTSMQHFRALKNNGRAPRQQLDLPYRPRYIHRGSGAGLLCLKPVTTAPSHPSGRHCVPSRTDMSPFASSEYRHSCIDSAGCKRCIEKPGVDRRVLRPVNKLDLELK